MRHWSALTLALALLAGCGSRSVPLLTDGGEPPDGVGPAHDGMRIDGCVRPPGSCSSDKDCSAGYTCKGCFVDPCCPDCRVCLLKCVAKTECTSNSDCTSDKFCAFPDGDCGKSKPGTCKARPTFCPEYYSPTCGCDGKDYGNPCDANASGTSVASAGKCSQQKCGAINTAYVAAVAQAKACCPMCDSIQCAVKVKDSLMCTCQTFVEGSNTSTLATMKSLESQWATLGCASLGWGCPPKPCATVNSATCDPSSSGSKGTCKDNGWP